MSDVLQTRTENFEPKNNSIASESSETLRVFRSMHLHYTAILVFFFSEVLHEIWRIFPRSFNIVVISDVPTKYLIFCTKQTRKQSRFIDNIRHIMWPILNDFILLASWRVFVRKHWKVCCSILQWSDVDTSIWCRTCTVCFFRSLLRRFSSFPPIWVCEMKVLWKVASSRTEDLKTVFLYFAEYSVKNFIMTRQYVGNFRCSCWFRMCPQFHEKLVSYKCMLFVDCSVVLQEYFVNWARATKFQFFSWSTFRPESYVRHHACHTTVVVAWREILNF